MTNTIEWQDRVERLEANEDGLRSEFRGTLGHMHEVLAADKASGRVLSALRVTQLEHGKKLKEHSTLLARVVETQLQHGNKLEEHSTLLAELKADVTGLKTDVTELKSDVAGLKTDVTELKSDVAGLKTDVAGLKTDMVKLTKLVRRGFGLGDEE